MPYIAVTTSAPVSPETAETVKAELGKIITIFPGKTEGALMLNISGGNTMFFGGVAKHCAYVDIRLFRTVPKEAKEQFTEAAIALVADKISIPVADIFLSIAEYPSWGFKGKMFHDS